MQDLSKAKISELVPKGAIPYSKRPGFEELGKPTELICIYIYMYMIYVYDICIYIYVCMYIYIYVCIYIHTIYVYIHYICTHILISTSVSVYICIVIISFLAMESPPGDLVRQAHLRCGGDRAWGLSVAWHHWLERCDLDLRGQSL